MAIPGLSKDRYNLYHFPIFSDYKILVKILCILFYNYFSFVFLQYIESVMERKPTMIKYMFH